MGSKHSMLGNGLGDLIVTEAKHANRIVDLFCGGASVSWFAAEFTPLPVLSVDLQKYAVSLARAVVTRTVTLDAPRIAASWFDRTLTLRNCSKQWYEAKALANDGLMADKYVEAARELCAGDPDTGPIWNAYGGYYFSPAQALTMDLLLKCLPPHEPERIVCLSALIACASRCSASPGHTAQPFRPTPRAAPFLLESWSLDPLAVLPQALANICDRRANAKGHGIVADANEIARDLRHDDLVVVDPPYSAVQYSRFYHVLETISNGHCRSVTGAGRYPPIDERPQSRYSRKSESRNSVKELLGTLASSGATIIFTFPAGECSNGMSGLGVVDVAKRWFNIELSQVRGRFSTLGGNNTNRSARADSRELLLLMRPK